ncbi:MAG: non-heme iron oxygenase ferredoxin subunit [Acidimicrobiia bacterium]|nr:non-heme iron oxygenase ferredoxin subunit [Acidimicrobiia bacterium]
MDEWVRIAQLDQLPDGRGVRVDAFGHRIALFRLGEAVYALADRCSHAEASLSEGEVFEDEIECPRHGATFNLATGEALTLPATKPQQKYDVKIADGDVFLALQEAS